MMAGLSGPSVVVSRLLHGDASIVSEPIRMTCPNCRRDDLKVPPEYLGKKLRCKHCDHTFRAIRTEDLTPFPPAPRPVASKLTTKKVPCPNCNHNLRVKPEFVGRKIRCKYCDHRFRVTSQQELVPIPRPAENSRPVENVRPVENFRPVENVRPVENFGLLPTIADYSDPGIRHVSPEPSRQRVEDLEKEIEQVRSELAARTREHTTAIQRLQETLGQLA